jgi:DNA mismatch endonuclease (patch repair protein)
LLLARVPGARNQPQEQRGVVEREAGGDIERDKRSTGALLALGWTVVRIWEHESLDAAVLRAEDAI